MKKQIQDIAKIYHSREITAPKDLKDQVAGCFPNVPEQDIVQALNEIFDIVDGMFPGVLTTVAK